MQTDPFSKHARDSIRELLSAAKKKSDFLRVQCVWLRVEFNMKAAEVAQITNLHPGTVRKIWSSYRKEGKNALLCKTRGGRRNYHLSREEEKLFLTPFFKRAERSSVLDVGEIKEAYENLIGKEVPKSTVYRLLSRHGWKRRPGRMQEEQREGELKTDMHEYWIGGCSQVLHPERTGNISQQWLHNTLQSMVRRESKSVD